MQMQNLDDINETYHLRGDRGKTVIRRPHPPATSVALDDNFDAITVSRGDRRSRQRPPEDKFDPKTTPASQADREQRPWNHQTVPLVDDFDAMTLSRMGGPSRTIPPPNDNVDEMIFSRGDVTRRRLNRILPLDDNSDVQTATRDNPHLHRNSGCIPEPRRRMADGTVNESVYAYGTYMNEMAQYWNARDSDAKVTRGRSPSGARRPVGVVREGRRGSSSPSARNKMEVSGGKILSRHDGGSGATGYQIVEDRVVEDGPLRTVSMWREEVARSAMEPQPKNIPMFRTRPTSGYDADVDKDGAVVEVDGYAYQWRRGHEYNMHAKQRSGGKGKEKPKSPLGNSVSNPSSANRNETKSGSNVHSKSSGSPSKDRKAMQTGPRTSTQNTASRPFITERSPNSNNVTTASNLSLRAILASCNPSLLHITPILADLGVLRGEHLVAVARMSEETRDREVKQIALRKGITIVEWAILLDRLQSL